MSELKPCPFCGGEAELTGFEAPEYWVWCPNCKASTDAHTCKQPAIEAWNTRVETVFVTGTTTVTDTPQITYVRERTCKLKATTVGWSCSACHVVSWQTVTKPKPNYCPNCGAKVVSE